MQLGRPPDGPAARASGEPGEEVRGLAVERARSTDQTTGGHSRQPLLVRGHPRPNLVPQVVRDDAEVGRGQAKPVCLWAAPLASRAAADDFLRAVPDRDAPVQLAMEN